MDKKEVDEKEVLFHPELLQKFDINGPRYTSYPSADRFHSDFSEQDYVGALQRVAKLKEPMSLYFHLPFCPNICYYCGCNKIITKDHCLLYTSPSPRDRSVSRMPSSA